MTQLTIAYWCVLIAIIMPIIWIGIAKAGTKNYIDRHNSAPRELLSTLKGFRKRAVWAQKNAFEALPGFMAGTIIAHLMEAPQFELNITAIIFIIARLSSQPNATYQSPASSSYFVSSVSIFLDSVL